MLRATFLDLDGTLVDTEPFHYAALRDTLATVGIALGEEDYFRRYLALTDRATFEHALRDAGRPNLERRIDELVADKEERFAERLEGDLRLLEGAAEFVA